MRFQSIIVIKEKFYGGLASRVIKTKQINNVKNDIIIIDGYDNISDIVHGCIGFDLLSYYYNLLFFSRNVMY